MASRGSVIPLFVDQIKSGQPLTITDPNMTRFMMTLEDAVDLVLFAFENAQQGDLFVQKAPASTIELLANTLIDMYGVSNELKIMGGRLVLLSQLVLQTYMNSFIRIKKYT